VNTHILAISCPRVAPGPHFSAPNRAIKVWCESPRKPVTIKGKHMINGQDNALLGAFFDTILQLFNAGSTGTGSTDGGGVS